MSPAGSLIPTASRPNTLSSSAGGPVRFTFSLFHRAHVRAQLTLEIKLTLKKRCHTARKLRRRWQRFGVIGNVRIRARAVHRGQPARHPGPVHGTRIPSGGAPAPDESSVHWTRLDAMGAQARCLDAGR